MRARRTSDEGAPDRGVALLWAVLLVQVLVIVAAGGLLVAIIAARHAHATAVADLAAVAAAQSAADPCSAAQSVVAANRLQMPGCIRDGDDVVVTVTAAVTGLPARLVALLGASDGRITVTSRAGSPSS